MKQSIRLSQCMIVKNEEKNIQRALSWAKEIAIEQIVVDTGSTDRTVELAKEMGAKIYHFQWMDDFSAAKNYAINQAKGNWIAFLDADEYFTEQDTKTLIQILKQLETKTSKQSLHLIRCKLVNLDEQGKPFAISAQDRVFRNLPELRYSGRIHERLTKKNSLYFFDASNQISIFHTGYSWQAYQETAKASRNIKILQKALADQPEDYDLWSYLGDSLVIEQRFQEAIGCFQKVLFEGPGPGEMLEDRFYSAGIQLLKLFTELQVNVNQEVLLNIAAKMQYPDSPNPDIYYYLGKWYLLHKDYRKACEELETGLKKLESYTGSGMVAMSSNLENVYIWLAGIYQHLKQPQQVIRYGVLALRMNPWNSEVLVQLLILLKEESEQTGDDSGTWKFLQKLYHFDQLKDQLFVLKCAKGIGFQSLEDRIFRLLPKEARERLLRHTSEKEQKQAQQETQKQ